MAYFGNTPITQNFTSGTDYFSGTGSQTAFTLTRVVNSPNDIEVVINNVVQQPNTAYTISGTTITFTSAPSSGSSNIYVRYLSTTTQTIAPSPATVQYSSLNGDNQSKLGISFKNRIINSAMVIDQRNAGASVTVSSGSTSYPVDRMLGYVETGSSGTFTAQQSTTVPAGFKNSVVLTTATADSSITASEGYSFQHRVEGLNVADLGWGTANAQTITLSFWVRSSLTGTFAGSVTNGSFNRAYVFNYSISSANTWEYKTVTIAGDTGGTWLTTNGIGLIVYLSMGAGSNYNQTAGSWGGFGYSTSGAVNLIGTNGATLYITGVQLEVGTQATTFDYRSYGTELALCQRYYYKNKPNAVGNRLAPVVVESTTAAAGIVQFPVSMRTNPTSLEQSGTASDYSVYGSGGAIVCSAVPSTATATNDQALVALTVASGLTAGQAGQIRAATTNGYLAWSAEL